MNCNLTYRNLGAFQYLKNPLVTRL